MVGGQAKSDGLPLEEGEGVFGEVEGVGLVEVVVVVEVEVEEEEFLDGG
jgi:hypothetical protein